MKITRLPLVLLPLLVAACAGRVVPPGGGAVAGGAAPIEVGIIAINDFHGNLEPPRLAVATPRAGAEPAMVPAGGAAYLASAIATLRRRHPQSITVSAGDMTGASPLVSSLFLDEPTVAAMNLIGVDLNAAGNHEFDRGAAELLRLQNGGCEKNTAMRPCQLDRFAGARYRYLAGNTLLPGGTSLLPGTALRTFGEGARAVRIGFIGLTTRTTGTLVSPAGIPGITFADEAETANRLVPDLRAAGADAIVVLIHEGGYPKPETDPNACEGFTGAIREIADRLDPTIGVVVSGHTHKAYICDLPRADGAAPVLLTSAGKYGTIVTDLTLRFDPATHKLVDRRARNVIVQGEGFGKPDGTSVATTDAVPRFAADRGIADLVGRYAAASGPRAKRVVGRLSRPLVARADSAKPYENEIGDLIADAQLAATRAPAAGAAQIALMNLGGIRADLTPAADGTVTYGDVYAVQPFGNTLLVREFTGAQLRTVLEQQFREKDELWLSVAGLTYAFDTTRPLGARIGDVRVDGRPLDDRATYRVAISNFLANGGDAFKAATAGRDIAGGMLDLDALTAYFAAGPVTPPATDRVSDRTPR